MEGVEQPKRIYCDMIIESVRHYSIYYFEIREFLKVYGKRNMVEEIREVLRNDEMENEILDLIYYITRNSESEMALEIKKIIEEYRKYQELKIMTFQIRSLSKLIILNRMIREGYL